MRASCVVVGIVVGALALPNPARAGDTNEACAEAHLQAQRLRKQAKLRSAHEALLTCARPQCPALTREECGPWLEQIEGEIPTVVVSATDDGGQDIGAVRVTIDNDLRVSRLDGRPIEVDPGEHVLRFESAGFGTTEQRVIVNLGEKNRVLRVRFQRSVLTEGPSDPARNEDSRSDVTTPKSRVGALVAFGVGAVALGTFASFGIAGRNRESDLSDHCAPLCSLSDRDDVLRDYRIADVSLGVAVVAVGIGAWLWFTSSGTHAH